MGAVDGCGCEAVVLRLSGQRHFVKTLGSLRGTPAMEAGIENIPLLSSPFHSLPYREKITWQTPALGLGSLPGISP
jgi:hypothetical protein